VSRPRVEPVRHLGRLALITLGLNGVIGGGIFVLPAQVAALSGASSTIAYLLAGAVALGIGTSLALLGARFETSGGPYAYAAAAFGPAAGFQVGWLFCLARLTAMANLLNGAALYLGALLPRLAEPGPRAALILAAAAVVLGVLVAGIRQTALAAEVLAVAKVAPLLLLGVAGLWLVGPERLRPEAVEPGSMLRSVLLLIYAFTGFETLTVPAEEARAPRRDIPIALGATLGIVCGLYLLVHVAALGGLENLAGETAPLATLADRLAGPPGRLAMTLVATVSMAGCALASLVGASRMLYAMAAAGQIPRTLGALDPRRRTPAVAAILTATIGAGLAIFGGYAFLAAVSSGSRLLIYLACSLAALRGASAGALARGVPVVTAAAIVVLLFGLKPSEVLFGMIGVGVGLGLFFLARFGRRETEGAEAT
jgi:amino acid transporter